MAVVTEDEFIEAAARFRNPDGSYNKCAIAKELGITRSSVQYRFRHSKAIKRFTAPKLPSRTRSLEEIKAARREEGARSIEADYARDLIEIPVHIDGPIAILAVGDPHLDDPGSDYALLERHLDIARRNPAVFAVNIGDVTNNWIGRLERLYADQTTTAKEAWMLAEDFVTSVDWLAHVAGNHDLWSGSRDPLGWLTAAMGQLYEPDGVRLALRHPCGTQTRIHARHAFPGNSMWNKAHGMTKEVMMGFRDHLLFQGHLHSGAESVIVGPDGLVSTLVMLSGYKVADKYRHTLGYKRSPIHPSAFIIIDPREQDTSRARCYVAPTPEIGERLLNLLRSEYEAKNVPSRQRPSSRKHTRSTAGRGGRRSGKRV